jgi:exodeoxyribonuclease VII large subunit
MTFRNNNLSDVESARTIFSVSKLNEKVQLTLERAIGSVWVEGEISNFIRAQSGHSYFSLKDDASQLRCAMFRAQSKKIKFVPKNGDKVVAYGRVGIYATRGEYQLIIDTLEPLGSGALQLRFETLKEKLFKEGLFDADKKRSFPKWPKSIGLVTSPSGAAIRDILAVLKRRCPTIPVIIYPTLVQGSSAIANIVNAIEIANKRMDCDVLIISRGGGSLEDLWAFNEELVANAIFNSGIPIVSGVGHEKDITICDLVADIRAATPSAAAEIISPDLSQWSKDLYRLYNTLNTNAEKIVRDKKNLLGRLNRSLISPKRKVEMDNQKLDDLATRLTNHVQQKISLSSEALNRSQTRINSKLFRRQIDHRKNLVSLCRNNLKGLIKNMFKEAKFSLSKNEEILSALGPFATLQRGYAIVTDEKGRIIRKGSKKLMGQSIKTQLHQGTLSSTVTDTNLDVDK